MRSRARRAAVQEHVYSPLSDLLEDPLAEDELGLGRARGRTGRDRGVFLGTAAPGRQRGRYDQADREAPHCARPARRSPYRLISAAARMRIVLATIMTVATGMSRLVWPDSRNPEYR